MKPQRVCWQRQWGTRQAHWTTFPSFCPPPQGGPFGDTLTTSRAELRWPRSFDTCYPKALRPTPALPHTGDEDGLLPWSLVSHATQVPGVLHVLSGHSPLTGPPSNHQTPEKGGEGGLETPVPNIQGSPLGKQHALQL